MKQLMFDLNNSNIIDGVPSHILEYEELPYEVRCSIENISKKRYLYQENNNKYYCSNCFLELDENNYCNNCKRQLYKIDDEVKYKELDSVYSKYNDFRYYNSNKKFYYYYFDIVDSEVLLYLIEEVSSIYSNNTYRPLRKTLFNIKRIYHICDNYYNEVIKDGVVYYDNIINAFDMRIDELIDDDSIISDYTKSILLYSDGINNDIDGILLDFNLDKLSNSLYKYCNIFSILDRLNYDISINILELVVLPLKYPLFERLFKLRLYNLAFSCFRMKVSNSSFYGVFKLDKTYLEFMQENDINLINLESLRLCKVKNMDVVEFVDDVRLYNYEEYNLDYERLYNIFNKNKYSNNVLAEYFDYLEMATDLGYDLKDKKILYPDNIIEEHNKLITKIETISNPLIDSNINTISNNLKFNLYEDDKYIIFPASSVEEIVEEATNQQNCLVMYCEPYSSGESEIYFLRDKSKIDESLVTIEVKNRKVVQARCKYNEIPNKELKRIINEFENNLVLEYTE